MTTAERLSSALADRYRIERELGQGGMATVYLAEDLKHGRKVALKVLKPELAAVLGADRFVIEIRTTAALQHPHILPLFDSGTADGFLYYVMPFIEGETLRDKLNRETQLGVDEAVRIAREVADALDYAHGKGIIHRDIKPENILIQNGRPMVADFGIALAVSAAAGGRMTETGLSLGTPHYMSPEQATADKEISARSDVYSLATVLYESLAGQPPHIGGSAQQIIMKIIAEPVVEVTRYRKTVPPNVTEALSKALEKLPADRFESARAFAAALANPGFVHRTVTSVGEGRSNARSANRGTIALAGLAAVLALLLAKEMLSGGAVANAGAPVVQFALANDRSHSIHTGATRPFAVSPDGRTIVYRASTDSTAPHLWLRTIDEPSPRQLEGTADGMNPAFSPDGQTIAFMVQNTSLRIVPRSGGNARQVATLSSVAAALSWASNDEIVFEAINPDAGIQRISTSGGSPELVVPLDTAGGEIQQRRPLVLRDAGIIAYGSTTRARNESEIALYRPSDGRRVQTGLSGIGPLALIDGHLVYAGALGELMAVRLDTRAVAISGSPVKLTTRVAAGWTGSAAGLSEGGTLVYRTEGASTDARLDLVDTTGVGRSVPGAFAAIGTPRFSPDGKRVVLGLGTQGIRGRRTGIVFADLWVVDVASGLPTRLTSGSSATAPSWFGDGKRVLYSTQVNGKPGLWTVPVGGGAPASLITDFGGAPRSSSATPDGKAVLAATAGIGGGALLRVWLDSGGRRDTLLSMQRDGIRAEDPRVSPDGRWVAFVERSSYEVWVRSLTTSTMMQVSARGTDGNPVVWGPDSRRLYYVNSEGLHVIELETAPSLDVRNRRHIGRFPTTTDYDLSPVDGHTFVVVLPIRSTSDVVVAVNWVEEARRAWSAPPPR